MRGHTNRSWAAILAVTASVSGCMLGYVAYSEPETGPLARVRFIVDTGVWTAVSVLRQYDDGDCQTGEREVARFSANHNHKNVGISDSPLMNPALVTEIRVRAGQPFYGMFASATTLPSSCRAAFEFLPETGRDYQVTFQWNVYKAYCGVRLAKVDRSVESSSKNIEVAFAGMVAGQSDPPRQTPGRCNESLTRLYWY